MTGKKHDRIILWSDFPVFPLLMWKMAYLGLLYDFWIISSFGGDSHSPKWFYSPRVITARGGVYGWTHFPHGSEMAENTLETLLLFLSTSTDGTDVPGVPRWVVGVFSGFTDRKTVRVHVHIQESLAREILTLPAAGQGWHQAELLILKMCCLEGRKRSEVCVTFNPPEI